MDFTQSFLQGVQQGQQRASQKKAQERADEEFDLKKQMLQVEMKKLDITQKVAARKNAIDEAGARKNFDVQGGIGAGQSTGMPTLDFAAGQVQGPQSTVPVQIPEGGYGEPAETWMAPTRTGERQNKFKDLYEETRTKQQALADSPPTQDQVIDNARQAQIAEDTRQQRIQSNQLALMNAQSGMAIRNLTYQIQKDRLELDKEKAQNAKEEAARSNNPAAIRTVTEAVINRNLDYAQLDRYQRANVDAMLAAAGMPIPRTLTGTEKANQTKADSGFQSTEIVAEILAKNPAALLMVEVPGLGRLSPEAQALKLHRAEMSDVKSRLRTGAAQNDYETTFYGKQIPTAGDYLNPEIIKTKLNHFRGLYLAETGRPIMLTSPDGKQTTVISDGYNPNQRSLLRKKINEGWTPGPFQLTLPENVGQAAAPAQAPGANPDPLGILK